MEKIRTAVEGADATLQLDEGNPETMEERNCAYVAR